MKIPYFYNFHFEKKHVLFFFSYLFFLYIAQFILGEILYTVHFDKFYYQREALKISENSNVIEIIINIFTLKINLPLISFYALLFKIYPHDFTVYLFNSFLFLFIYINLNNILGLLNLKKINFLEFFLLSGYLNYFNIGINKEIFIIFSITTLFFILLKSFKIKQLNIKEFSYLILILIIFAYIKPFHLFVLLIPMSILLISFILLKKVSKKYFILFMPIFFAILFILNIINQYYSDYASNFHFFNIIDFINYNRNNTYLMSITNSNLLSYTTNVTQLSFDIFSHDNILIYSSSVLSSLIFPSLNDLFYGITNNSRFLLLISFESFFIKVGFIYALYKSFFCSNKLVYIIYLLLFLYMTFIIAINIPNDGISYRYLYPYKFIAIFFGYNYIKKLALKFV